jgi:hypothetical protein
VRPLFLIAVAIVLFSCGPSLAQIAALPNAMGTTSSTTPPSSTQPPTFAGPANVPLPTLPGGPLGAIQFNLGNPIVGGAPGAIQICSATGTPGAIANFPVDETDMTTNAAPSFGTSELSGNCSPGSPASSPEILSGSDFSDGAVPLTATEAGGLGLSPLIAVPSPGSPSAACISGSGMLESPGLTAPYYSGDAASTSVEPGC